MVEIFFAIQCNLVDNQHQHNSEVSFTFSPNGFLLSVEPSDLVFLKTYKTEFDDITIACTNNKTGGPLWIEHNVSFTLAIDK